ncbi:hypothetical protein OAC11_05115 [Alphaproteobacteria bacterium]|nr:hypothetical protein [Alphaproteobacteria bacterium]
MMANRLEVLTQVAALISQSSVCSFLRKGELIFDGSVADDIDLLINDAVDAELWKYLKSVGFKKKVDLRFLNIYLYGSRPHIHYVNTTLDLHFDCVFGLYHRSVHLITKPGFEITHWIPLDKVIQEESVKNLRTLDVQGLILPCLRLEVELVHLIAHVILDKKGCIDLYYKNRIRLLLDQVDMVDFKYMLNLVFFRFSNHLIEQLQNNKFDSLFEQYLTYRDY